MSDAKQKHPRGLYVLFGTEAAERFSFYTMRAILVLYLTSIVFLGSFRASEDYREELSAELAKSPESVFEGGIKDLEKAPSDAFTAALGGDPAEKGKALFLSALKAAPDRGALLDRAFDRANSLREHVDPAAASISSGGSDFAVWVVARRIKDDIRDEALHVYGLYLLFVYAMGLLGGYFADKVLGSRKAIVLGGLVMGAGLFVMASQELVFYGLALVVAGNGFFKPNISTIVSGLYAEDDKRRDGAFTIFYMGINLGAFLAIFGAGYAEAVAETDPTGWNLGFIFAGIGMILSLILFIWGQKHLGTAGFPPNREVTPESRLETRDWRDVVVWAVSVTVLVVLAVMSWSFVGPIWTALPGWVQSGVLIPIFGGIFYGLIKSKLTVEEWQRIAVVFIISFFVIFFWAGFEQAGGTMNLFAYERTDRHIGGWEMPATFFQGFNPLFIIILALPFAKLWSWNDSKSWGLSTPAKMGVGMILLGLGFVVMYFGQLEADELGLASLWWLVAVYLIHTVGELCLSPIGLSMVTKLSPVRVVSLMMGVWFACTAVADYLSGRLEYIVHQHGINLWVFLISVSCGAGVVLLIMTPLLRKWMHGRG